jgi:hypothetical protein
MDELLSAALDAHGGLDNWQKARTLTARLSLGGPFWAARGGAYGSIVTGTPRASIRWRTCLRMVEPVRGGRS